MIFKITYHLLHWSVKARSYYTAIGLQCQYIDYFLLQVTAALPHFKLKLIWLSCNTAMQHVAISVQDSAVRQRNTITM